MNKKYCELCVYHDSFKPDDTIKCCSPERQSDNSVEDCCILEAPLRALQNATKQLDSFILVTRDYIRKEKLKSKYWRAQILNESK